MRYLLIAIISGLMFGAAMTLTKLWLSPLPVSSLAYAWELYAILAIGIAGFLILQMAFRGRKASQVTLVMTAVATTFPMILGLFLGEVLAMYEALGILFLLAGAFTLLSKGI